MSLDHSTDIYMLKYLLTSYSLDWLIIEYYGHVITVERRAVAMGLCASLVHMLFPNCNWSLLPSHTLHPVAAVLVIRRGVTVVEDSPNTYVKAGV